MRISDWSSDVCSSDLPPRVNRTFLNITDETARLLAIIQPLGEDQEDRVAFATSVAPKIADQYGEETLAALREIGFHRSEEHTSELQSLMRISYAVFCLKKKKKKKNKPIVQTNNK